MQKIIDLTLPYTDHMPCQSAFPGNVFVQLKSHEETLVLKQGTPEDPFTPHGIISARWTISAPI